MIIVCYCLTTGVFHIKRREEIPLIYKAILRPSEVIIFDLETGERFYSQSHQFYELARWEEDDYQVEEPKNIKWKYRFIFKYGSTIVEVYLAKEFYYKVNDICYKVNDRCSSDGLYYTIKRAISFSIEGYDCSKSYWCTNFCESNE